MSRMWYGWLWRSRDKCEAFFFFFNDTATTEIYTLSLHDALPICAGQAARQSIEVVRLLAVRTLAVDRAKGRQKWRHRSEEHTSELQSLTNLVCRLLLEKKNISTNKSTQ